jgi:hypothetical protein
MRAANRKFDRVIGAVPVLGGAPMAPTGCAGCAMPPLLEENGIALDDALKTIVTL